MNYGEQSQCIVVPGQQHCTGTLESWHVHMNPVVSVHTAALMMRIQRCYCIPEFRLVRHSTLFIRCHLGAEARELQCILVLLHHVHAWVEQNLAQHL